MPTFNFVHHTPHPIEEVWWWFEQPGALVRLSPPWLPLAPVQESASLETGFAVLQPTLAGVKLPLPAWHAKHIREKYVAGHQFADEAASEPWSIATKWHHVHEFEPVAGGTRIIDRVTTTLPLREVAPVFAWRHAQLDADLAAHKKYPGSLAIAITGSGGMIGRQLAALLSTGGHRVIELVRSPRDSKYETRVWNPENPDPNIFTGVDAVVHLAGAPILGRFTDEHKKEIRDSRVGPTRKLAEAIVANGDPKTLVSASAVGYYGIRGETPQTENAPVGDDFLARVVDEWEQATEPASDAGVRVVTMRTASMVLSAAGGALGMLRLIFETGAAGRIGSGRQWMSWIGLNDIVEIYLRALVDVSLVGPVNAVAPEPVQNIRFTKELGRALRRPTIVPTPAFAPKLLLGEEGYREMLTASHREVPAKLESVGHEFRSPKLAGFFAREFGRVGRHARASRAAPVEATGLDRHRQK